jgi:hypothetical protein
MDKFNCQNPIRSCYCLDFVFKLIPSSLQVLSFTAGLFHREFDAITPFVLCRVQSHVCATR